MAKDGTNMTLQAVMPITGIALSAAPRRNASRGTAKSLWGLGFHLKLFVELVSSNLCQLAELRE